MSSAKRLTAPAVNERKAWWPASGWPSRTQGVQLWHKKQRWVEAGLLSEWERSTSGWLCSTWDTRDKRSDPEASANGKNSQIKTVLYLILRDTPWGTPTLTVAPRMLWRLILVSAPYSTTVPKNPDLQRNITHHSHSHKFT